MWGLPSPEGAPDYTPVEVFSKSEYRRTYHTPQDDWGQQGGILRCDPYVGRVSNLSKIHAGQVADVTNPSYGRNLEIVFNYARSDEEGRTLLQAAFQSPARLEVADGELRMTVATQSSPHRTVALSALCEQLDALAIPFPGTHLRLRLAVQAPEPVIS